MVPEGPVAGGAAGPPLLDYGTREGKADGSKGVGDVTFRPCNGPR